MIGPKMVGEEKKVSKLSGLRKVNLETQRGSRLRENPAPPVAPKPKAGLTGSASVGFTGSVGPNVSIRAPRFELEGKKWVIENHRNNPNLSIRDADMSQSVYVYQCDGSTVKIDGKVYIFFVSHCCPRTQEHGSCTFPINAFSSFSPLVRQHIAGQYRQLSSACILLHLYVYI
jgi:hypothetical protein